MRVSRVSVIGLLALAACAPKLVHVETSLPKRDLEPVPIPSTASAILVVDLAATSTGIDALWLEKTSPARAALNFAAFTGTSWGPTFSVAADLDLDAALSRSPSLEALDDGSLRARWFDAVAGGHAPRTAGSVDGGATWEMFSIFATPFADGAGPISWVDLGFKRQALAWIAPFRRTMVDQRSDTVFSGVPGAKLNEMDLQYVEYQASANSGLSTARAGDKLLVGYRQRGRISTTNSTRVYVDLIENGAPRHLHSNFDSFAYPETVNGTGPVLATHGNEFVAAYSQLHGFQNPVLVVWRPPSNRVNTFRATGTVHDLHVWFDARGQIVTTDLEGGYAVVRWIRGIHSRAERVGPGILDANTRLAWAGELRGRVYLAFLSGVPARLRLERIGRAPPSPMIFRDLVAAFEVTEKAVAGIDHLSLVQKKCDDGECRVEAAASDADSCRAATVFFANDILWGRTDQTWPETVKTINCQCLGFRGTVTVDARDAEGKTLSLSVLDQAKSATTFEKKGVRIRNRTEDASAVDEQTIVEPSRRGR